MTMEELAAGMADKADIDLDSARDALAGGLDLLAAELVRGGEVSLPGLGKIEIVQRAERRGRNPQTGERMWIPAKKVAKLKVTAPLKSRIAAL